MTGLPDIQLLGEVTEQTWPAAEVAHLGPWTLRDGRGGGKRVSAATAKGRVMQGDLRDAEEAMQKLGQAPLFMIREGQTALDDLFEQAGYKIIDPVNVYACDLEILASAPVPPITAFDIWPPLAIQVRIWAEGGIGPARLDVMQRVRGAKTSLLGRSTARAAATGFVALHNESAMIHALEVEAEHRRAGMGRHLTRHAAKWAQAQGARFMAVLCTKGNVGANALYSSLGMVVVGQYHYRIKEGPLP